MKSSKILSILLTLLLSLAISATALAQTEPTEHNDKIIELVFILDRSGSMSGLEKDTIGGYNAFIAKQQQLSGKAYLTTVLFDHKYELLHDRMELQEVQPLTDKDYYVRGSTALLDAIGKTIISIEQAQKQASKDKRASQILFVITTDGMENASREFTYEKIRQMIEKKKKQDWQFIFLGANIDSAKTAAKFGINKSMAADYHADSRGVQKNYEVLNSTVGTLRTKGSLPAQWKKDIEEDYQQRNQ